MKRRICAVLVSLSILVGMFSSVTVLADSSTAFALNSISTSFKDNTVPVQLPVQVNANTSNGTGVTLNWSVDHQDVATIDQNGLLTPKTAGVVNVTASADGQSQSCAVIVKNASLSVTSSLTQVLDNGTLQMGAKLSLSGCTSDYDVAVDSSLLDWKVDNDSLASIDATGLLTGKADGSVNVTATMKSDSSCTASQAISVVKGYIILTIPNGSVTQTDIGADMTPSFLAVVSYDSTDSGVTWSCSENKAKITDTTNENTAANNHTAKVTFTDSGKVTIRVTLKADPSIYADYVLNVTTSKDQLSNDLYEVEGYNSSKYTALRWNNLQTAARKAQSVLDDDNATQAQINSADAYLMKMVAELSLPDSVSTTGTVGSTTGSPNTGGSYPLMISAIVLLASCGVLVSKRLKNN